jgi:hypothetical protein
MATGVVPVGCDWLDEELDDRDELDDERDDEDEPEEDEDEDEPGVVDPVQVTPLRANDAGVGLLPVQLPLKPMFVDAPVPSEPL